MTLKRMFAGLLFALTAFSSTVFAQEPAVVGKADEPAIKSTLSVYRLNVESIDSSPIAGLFEVVTNGGVVYANHDASYFIYGNLIHTTESGSVNLTEQANAKRNKAIFEKAGVKDEMIEFAAKNEKYVVNVFTDTTCGYCLKLHREMAQYNDLGITIRYLAYPRAGVQASNFGQMSAVWCAEDQKSAMNQAKSGSFDGNGEACEATVKRHLALGRAVGVSGTPAILLENGTLLSGYLPPAQLIEVLQQQG